uniref:RNA recognition motif domain containing protein n=1 Tax=Haemonchus contortus TaxID=6289 RepID=A0A7I4YPM9_HAECO
MGEKKKKKEAKEIAAVSSAELPKEAGVLPEKKRNKDLGSTGHRHENEVPSTGSEVQMKNKKKDEISANDVVSSNLSEDPGDFVAKKKRKSFNIAELTLGSAPLHEHSKHSKKKERRSEGTTLALIEQPEDASPSAMEKKTAKTPEPLAASHESTSEQLKKEKAKKKDKSSVEPSSSEAGDRADTVDEITTPAKKKQRREIEDECSSVKKKIKMENMVGSYDQQAINEEDNSDSKRKKEKKKKQKAVEEQEVAEGVTDDSITTATPVFKRKRTAFEEEQVAEQSVNGMDGNLSVNKKKKKKGSVDILVDKPKKNEGDINDSPLKKEKIKKEKAVEVLEMVEGVTNDAGQTATPTIKKKRRAMEEQEAPEETKYGMNGSLSVKKKKKKIRESGDISMVTGLNESVNDDTPQKKKKKSTVVATVTTKQPEGEYVAGSLSRIFGGSSAPPQSETVPIIKGETVIRPKMKKAKEESKADTESPEPSSKQEPENKWSDRVQQRENRKKEQRMTLDEKKRTIFVGNAPLSMDERSCKKLFSQYGLIESVRMRSVMPPKQTITKRIAHISHSFHEKQNSLNFYVKFKDEESVKKALSYNGTIVDRHRVRVDTCTTKADYDRKLTAFVGNLPLDVKDDELAEFFEENVGGVSFVRCVRDSSSGMGKGIGFVVFKSPSSLPLALSLTGVEYQKRELRITKVMRKAKVAKVQQARKKSSSTQGPKLNKNQEEKINKYKFSTKKTQQNERPVLKKKARKAIQKKKSGKPVKSLMQ